MGRRHEHVANPLFLLFARFGSVRNKPPMRLRALTAEEITRAQLLGNGRVSRPFQSTLLRQAVDDEYVRPGRLLSLERN
jgi:hypothetical protein